MATAPLPLPPTVQSYVSDFVARARRLSLWRAAGRAVAFVLAVALLTCVVDRYTQLPAWARAGAFATALLGAFLILLRPLHAALRRQVDWVHSAYEIEEHSPQFAQRLLTVTSRLLGPPEHRGSDDMLYQLLRDVDQDAATQRSSRALPAGRALRPWLLVALLGGVVWGLAKVPGLELPDLMLRFALPMVDLPPVTTTRLEVTPGDVNVQQARPLHVSVRVEKLPPDDGVMIFYSKDRKNWSHAAMAPAEEGEGRYEFTLSSIERDLKYYITGGDARSPDYSVRVLRAPAVASFTIRYNYPAYTLRPPLTVTNTDGLIEAPAGTEALLTVTSTEPLQSALLRLPGQKVLMQPAPGEDDRVCQAVVRVQRDGRYELDLISTRKVAGGGPSTMRLRAVPDSPPLARLLQPSGSLRLNPRDILPLTYEALDDYGVESLSLVVQAGSAQPAKMPLKIHGDARRQGETYNLDLADIPLKIGDVVTITVVARDGARKEALSEPLQVLVSPRSVDVDTHVRVSELNSASQMASLVVEELEAAAAALAEAEREKVANATLSVAATARANKHVSSAAEMATLVRQALLRAVVRADTPELSIALATWVDALQVLSSQTEDLFRQKSMSTGAGEPSTARLNRLLEQARRSRDELRTVAHGEQAAALLADRQNVKESESQPAPADGAAAERLGQTLQRAREEIAAGVVRLGIDPAAGNLDDQLNERVNQATSVVKAQRPVDFVAAGQEWSQALQRDPLQPTVYDERLLTAAQAEAVRPFGELVRARDLHLAGRAAAAMSAEAAEYKLAGQVVGAGGSNQFVQALAALQREHELDRPTAQVRKPEEAMVLRNAADHARQLMAGWAGDVAADTAPASGPATRLSTTERASRRRAEELALNASAETARGNYDEADRIDNALIEHIARTASTQPVTEGDGPPAPARLTEQRREVARTVDTARQIDRIGQDQGKITEQTQAATKQPLPPDAPPSALAVEQQKVASAIATVEVKRAGRASSADLTDPEQDPNWRSRATATVVAAQEQLAAMPRRLAEAQRAAGEWHKALGRAQAARRDAAAAEGDRRAAAERAARQMEQDAADAEVRMRKALLPILPTAGEALAGRLSPFAPETAGARDVVATQLVPALTEIEQSILQPGADPAAGDRAAGAARLAIEAAQNQLAAAQESFTQRDPLVAAKWFARAAAESLAQSPPDFRAAQQRQQDASAALARAWDHTIHDAAAQRLGVVPTLQPLFAAPGIAPRHEADVAAAPTMAAAREWGRLRPRESEATLGAPLRDADPPGYENALQKYFESLGKVQGN